MNYDADVIVIGGGPSGSVAATLLAQGGHRVAVLERATFPRFSIGESLLPCDLALFDRIGFDVDESKYLRKLGAIFHDDRDGRETVFRFTEGLPGTGPHAYQVERSIFDDELLGIAAQAGAEVHQDTEAKQVTFAGDQVEVQVANGGTLKGRYLIDATGSKSLIGRQKRSIEPIRGFGIAAAFAHFSSIDPDVMEKLEESGDIVVLGTEFGWGWIIPLRGSKISVGFVTREKNLSAEFYRAAVASSPYVQRLVRGKPHSDPQLVGNFSFINRQPSGPRHTCIGDAAAFLDPVFSSGASLGMLGAELAADTLSEALASNTEDNPNLMDPVKDKMHHAYRAFGSLIHRFYNTRIVNNILFHQNPDPNIRAGLISVLAGDVWRDDNPFMDLILGGRQRWGDEYLGPSPSSGG